MSKYIIACGVFHPTMNASEILNATNSGQTLSIFRTYDEMIIWLKKEKHLFYPSDTISEIDHATIFSFDDQTGRCFTQFIKDGNGKRFDEIYGDYLYTHGLTGI